MLKVSGVWVSPIEVERVLPEHPAVLEVAVIFLPDADELPKPAAFVALCDRMKPRPELTREIHEFVSAVCRLQASALGGIPGGTSENQYWEGAAFQAEGTEGSEHLPR